MSIPYKQNDHFLSEIVSIDAANNISFKAANVAHDG